MPLLRRLQGYLPFVFLTLGIFAGIWSSNFFARPGYAIFDFFQRQYAPKKSQGVALIFVDQFSLDQMAREDQIYFPFPRVYFGAVARVAAAAGARALVYDIIFSEPSARGHDDDQEFARLIGESRVPVFMPGESQGKTVHEPIAVIKNSLAGLGRVEIQMESDGTIRRLSEPSKTNSDLFHKVIYEKITGQTLAATIEETQDGYLKFYAPGSIPTLSFYKVLQAYHSLDDGKPLPPEFKSFKNLVWFVGYSAPGLHDMKSIPTEENASGTVVHASALSNDFEKSWIRSTTNKEQMTLLFAVCFVITGIAFFVRTPVFAGPIVFSILLLLSGLITFFAWRHQIWVNPWPLAFGGLISGGLQLIVKFQLQWKDQLKFAKTLESSMSKEMIDLIRNGQMQVARFGETRTLSVFFCDLAGFTSMSETISAEQLVAFLNDYLDHIVEIIFEQGGYVDKFIGDAVMAIWNAPLYQKDHAARAIIASIRVATAIEELNVKLREKYSYVQPFSARVGLHSGPAIVGNIGAQVRHNYTAIGDTVNLASRLEGVGKAYSCSLIFSEELRAHVPLEYEAGIYEVDQIAVKGRSHATRIYSYYPAAEKSPLKIYSEGLQSYYQGDFQSAISKLDSCPSVPAGKEIKRRSQLALKGQLPVQWKSGVWHFDEK